MGSDHDKLAQAIYDSLGRGSDADIRRIAAALREVHNSALEEAAKASENAWITSAASQFHGECIASAIRALKLPDNGGR